MYNDKNVKVGVKKICIYLFALEIYSMKNEDITQVGLTLDKWLVVKLMPENMLHLTQGGIRVRRRSFTPLKTNTSGKVNFRTF